MRLDWIGVDRQDGWMDGWMDGWIEFMDGWINSNIDTCRYMYTYKYIDIYGPKQMQQMQQMYIIDNYRYICIQIHADADRQTMHTHIYIYNHIYIVYASYTVHQITMTSL